MSRDHRQRSQPSVHLRGIRKRRVRAGRGGRAVSIGWPLRLLPQLCGSRQRSRRVHPSEREERDLLLRSDHGRQGPDQLRKHGLRTHWRRVVGDVAVEAGGLVYRERRANAHVLGRDPRADSDDGRPDEIEVSEAPQTRDAERLGGRSRYLRARCTCVRSASKCCAAGSSLTLVLPRASRRPLRESGDRRRREWRGSECANSRRPNRAASSAAVHTSS